MKKTFGTFALAAVTASVLSLPLAGGAFAATSQNMTLAANNTMDKTGEAASDTWITSKVKASFLADEHIKGTAIKVETNKGVVSLSGTVATEAQRDLAIKEAKAIKGVKAVSADGLKAAQ